MSKEWKCEECEKHGTGACYNSGRYYHDDCQYMVIDVDYAYQQGRSDAIDEFINKFKDKYKASAEYIQSGLTLMDYLVYVAEQMKGTEDGSR